MNMIVTQGSDSTAKPMARRLVRSREDGMNLFLSWIGLVLYCAFAFTLFYRFAFKARDLFMGVPTGVLALIGVVFAGKNLRRTLDLIKFGVVRITLEGEPPVLGGQVHGRIVLPGRAEEASTINVELRCLERVTWTDSKGRTRQREDCVWNHAGIFVVRKAGRLAQAEFQLPVPDEPSIQRGVGYRWEMAIQAELPGIDLSRTFRIVVAQPRPAQGPSSSPSASAASIGLASLAQPTQRDFVPARAFVMPVATRPPRAAAPASAQGGAGSMAGRAGVGAAGLTASTADLAFAVDEDSARRSAMVLIIANLVPVAGVMFLGWRIDVIVMLYWLENVVIGVINVVRMALGDPESLKGNPRLGPGAGPLALMFMKYYTVVFFIVHYGAFCAGHAFFLMILFGPKDAKGQPIDIGVQVANLLSDPLLVLAGLVLMASHVFSFVRKYQTHEAFRDAGISTLMMQPYGRIIVLHVFILGGGFAVLALGSPIIAILIFMLLKTSVDLFAHWREQRKLGAA